MDANKKLIAKIGGVFVAILLFLTFFSSTIYNFNLPSVVVGYTREGVLTNYAEGRGVVEFARMELYYADATGRIELGATAGDSVKAGGELYSITSDVQGLRDSLDERLRGEERLKLRIERAKEDRQGAEANLANLRNDADSFEFDPSEFDYDMKRTEAQISAAERELGDLAALFELGAVAQREIDEKEAALDGLATLLQQQNERKQRAQENFDKSVEAGRREYESRRKDLARVVSDYDFQIGDHEFELATNRAEIDKLMAQIEAGGRASALAGSGGIVREVRAGIETGAHVNKNELIMRIGAKEGGFKATVDLPESVDFISAGDSVTFNIRSRDLYGQSGEVESLMFVGGRLRATIRFESGSVTGGETIDLRVQSVSRLHEMVIPSRALRTDDQGDYVLYVERRESAFGHEYFARRERVSVIAQDNHNAAVWMYGSDEKPAIIISSDKALSEGDRVRIVG